MQATQHRYITSNQDILSGEPNLSLAQVFDALSYSSDHQDEINTFIARNYIAEVETDALVREETHHADPHHP